LYGHAANIPTRTNSVFEEGHLRYVSQKSSALQSLRLRSAKMGNIDNHLLQYANKRYQEGRGLMKSDLVKQLVSERYGRFAVAVLAHGATP